MRKRFTPSLLDRLFDGDLVASDGPLLSGISLESAKNSMARDLENLLNTRTILSEVEDLSDVVRASVVGFGVPDFSNKPLENPLSSSDICRCIEEAVAFFEPRLKNVDVSFSGEGAAGGRLHFVIKAILMVNSANESVNFDAMIQPQTLQCMVNAARGRGALPLGEGVE